MLTITAEDYFPPGNGTRTPAEYGHISSWNGPMLIDCPGCAKSYHISRAALGPKGRNVACPHCLTSWFVSPGIHGIADRDGEAEGKALAGGTEALPEIDAEFISERTRQPSYEELYGTPAKPQPAPIPAAPPARLPRAPVLVAAALGITMALIGFRPAIVKIWPQSNAAYAAAGFPVNIRGFELQHVHAGLLHNGTQPLLVVDGEIANLRSSTAQVPRLQLAVRDVQGHEIYTWDASSPKAKLDGGETIAFRARLAAPPADGHDVFVRFAAAGPK